MEAHVHQTVSGVVALVAPGDVAQPPDATLLVGLDHRLHRRADGSLTMDGKPHPLLLRFGPDGVGLGQVPTRWLLDFDIDPVLQHAHRQRVVKLGRRRDRHNVRASLLDHEIEVVVAGSNAQLLSERIQPNLIEIAERNQIGAGMRPIA